MAGCCWVVGEGDGEVVGVVDFGGHVVVVVVVVVDDLVLVGVGCECLCDGEGTLVLVLMYSCLKWRESWLATNTSSIYTVVR